MIIVIWKRSWFQVTILNANNLSLRQLHKNVESNIEQVLASTPQKAPTIRPPASHHENYTSLDEPDTQDTAGEARTNSSVMYSYGPPHMAKQKQDDQLEQTYSSYVRIRDVALKTCQKRWMIESSGERGPGISVLAARHDDDFKNSNLILIIGLKLYI